MLGISNVFFLLLFRIWDQFDIVGLVHFQGNQLTAIVPASAAWRVVTSYTLNSWALQADQQSGWQWACVVRGRTDRRRQCGAVAL